ncbi:integrin beta-PS isoform X1 [Schistocerca cancellata]|uniref:integrin beta-PS isoform X1 n=1 Tax=Schistocerca cancellata TaxID=274614 RepID=UPI0021189094|nr:integrin beta-PS isoform X1 [Schistocerca cancellata]
MEVRLRMQLLLSVVVLSLTVICAQKQSVGLQNPCTSKQTCSECIRTPTCAWCMQPSMRDGKRCFQPSSSLDWTLHCDEKYVYNPDNEYSIILNQKLSKGSRTRYQSSSSGTFIKGSSSSGSSSVISGGSSSGGTISGGGGSISGGGSSISGGGSSVSGGSSSSSGGGFYAESHSEAVQIAPQRVSLKLRLNQAYRIRFEYAQAEDYPVDLYYLMDLSKSMEDDKDKLSSLGTLLVDSMRNITSNFRLGFGSFVDKVVMPYVSTVPKNLLEPCSGCKAPYGFKNVMPLSPDANTFADKVRDAAVSGNLDAPEGGFDAIMQAVVCRDKIGWREKARRLLVFSTDAGFHYAGDGKLGGIVKPNDGECHLDSSGLYTHSTIQDYPSISQLNLKVRDNSIHVIFAVTAEQFSVYDQLRTYVEGSSSGQLSADSSNVVDLVKDQYNKISSSVEMKDNASSAVRITYYTSGLSGGAMKQTHKVDGLKVGSKVKFEAEIEVTECPKNRKDWQQLIRIYPVGVNESLLVDLTILGDCPCERKSHPTYKENAIECSGAGTYMCGICKCDAQHFGRKCECSSESGGKEFEGVNTCRPDNTSTVDCSGRGTCICGVCECDSRPNPYEVVSGTYCECDNFTCEYSHGEICSGPSHGICDCGKCKCKPEWTGVACDCPVSNQTCISPINGEVCSGHGECNCGTCLCDDDGGENRYTGKFCERRPGVKPPCAVFKDCVQCQMYHKGILTEEECANCTFVPISVDYVEADEDKGEVFCSYYDEDDCQFRFVYAFNDTGHVLVRAQEELDCPAEVYVLGIVLGVIAAIVLIGLAFILLWKVLTTIHDRREFARFEKERMMAKWDTGENPIYKQATSTFKNPTYAGK